MARTLAQEPGEPPLQELADVEDVQEEEQIEQGQETIDEQQVQDVAEALAGADESADAEQGATTADGTASLRLHEVALLEQAAASTDVVAQAPQVNLTPEMVQQFLVQKHQEMLRVRAPTQEPHRRSCAGPPALVLSRFSWYYGCPRRSSNCVFLSQLWTLLCVAVVAGDRCGSAAAAAAGQEHQVLSAGAAARGVGTLHLARPPPCRHRTHHRHPRAWQLH